MPDFNLEKESTAQLPQKQTDVNLRLSPSTADTGNLVAAIALRIRQSLDLELILQQIVSEVRQFMQVDRVLIYRFEPDFSGVVVVESVLEADLSIFGHQSLHDPCFVEKYITKYPRGKIQIVDDVAKASLAECYKDLLREIGVKANLVVPIVANNRLWGLLVAHQCHHPRCWQAEEAELLKQLTIQVGIAVQQAELYERVQSLNAYLEQKVSQRTVKLQRSIEFETLTRKVTEKMRDSLDEQHILQTVTQEIGQVLQIRCCKIELYNSDRTKAEVAYEYSQIGADCQGATRKVADFPELEQQLWHQQSLQFVEFASEFNSLKPKGTMLVCPIFDDRGIMGNLWLLRPPKKCFAADEVVLVEQVANQCAIAIRQARLYQRSQVQIKELERLNLLKDDFLKTISHELRTPMSSIQLASETLEALLEQEIGSQRSSTFSRVLDIFRTACNRQNQLVNDLLTLCYIDAKKEVLTMQWIDLSVWLPQIIEPFLDRIDHQQQSLKIDLPADLPQFKSDISTVKRILSELLNNACKYTPAGEVIGLTARTIDNKIQIIIHNTGVEIPSLEQERVFDKFYRIPNRDPWQFGGTGIGLALVKNLTELLGGGINLTSYTEKTIFTLELPLENQG
ncbi:MAG: GAF domain-containing sensor histidine kinase [Cyanobacteria bacterium J06643_13]